MAESCDVDHFLMACSNITYCLCQSSFPDASTDAATCPTLQGHNCNFAGGQLIGCQWTSCPSECAKIEYYAAGTAVSDHPLVAVAQGSCSTLADLTCSGADGVSCKTQAGHDWCSFVAAAGDPMACKVGLDLNVWFDGIPTQWIQDAGAPTGDCATLEACCEALAAPDQTACTGIAATNMAVLCNAATPYCLALS
jgi:hypothetical protein